MAMETLKFVPQFKQGDRVRVVWGELQYDAMVCGIATTPAAVIGAIYIV